MDTDSRRRHKACDACSQRKVRCNGLQRCQQCEHLNLRCEYSAPAPRRVRQKRMAHHEWTEPVRREVLVALERNQPGLEGNKGTGNEDREFFSALLPDFETFVLPFHPVITILEAQHAIDTMSTDSEARAFVYGLVAVTLNLTHSLRSELSLEDSDIGSWVSRSLNALQPVLHQEDVSVRRVATVQFIHVCLMGLGRHELAFYYLRQSTTMVELLRVSDDRSMAKLPSAERARRQRLYWTVFVRQICRCKL